MTDFLIAVVGHGDPFVFTLASTRHELYPARRHVTFGDLAAKLDDYHAFRKCACGQDLKMKENIWLTNITWDQDMVAALEDYHPQFAQPINPNDKILDVFPELGPCGSKLEHTFSVMFGRDLDVPFRQRMFHGVRRLRGDVCRVSYDREPSLPLPQVDDFKAILCAPGTCYVDTTEPLARWYSSPLRARIPVIRRPPGYGKSMCLSACATIFGDMFDDPDALPFPRVQPLESAVETMVLILDFASLSFRKDPTYEEVDHQVKQFMTTAAAQFYKTYAPNERPSDIESPWRSINYLANERCQQIFLGIDNYTTPFLGQDLTSYSRIQSVIWNNALAPIFSSGTVAHGLITGSELPGCQRPFSHLPLFAQATQDVTHDPEFAHAIGLSPQHVEDLGRAVLGPTFRAEEVFAPLGVQVARADAVICTRDAVDVLRLRQVGKESAVKSTLGWIPVGDMVPPSACTEQQAPV